MLTYEGLKICATEFLALTGLTDKEFQALLPAFHAAYLERYPPDRTLAGGKRQRAAGGGRRLNLAAIEDKLLFALVYQKSYPLQAVQGQLFEISQSSAKVLARIKRQKTSKKLIVDGTERRRQRPKKQGKTGPTQRHYRRRSTNAYFR